MTATDPDVFSPRWRTAVRWGGPALTLLALAALLWNCEFNPNIHFLMPGPGQWIIYPLPPELLGVYPDVELTTTFRSDFLLKHSPATALLSWRGLTNAEALVNGMVIPHDNPANWKDISQVDIAPFLRFESNHIEFIVKNKAGPPALSAKLKLDHGLVVSDETWQASVSGAEWRPAQLASTTPDPANNPVFKGLETTGGALKVCWPWLCLLAAISIGAVALLQCFLRKKPAAWKIAPLILGVGWLALFLHNIPLVPAAAGFDGRDHLTYVRYVQENHALPSASEGWEMFQPPLYYIISATLLGLFHTGAFHGAGMIVLRSLNMIIGLANAALIFAGLRLLFPGDWKKPLAGVMIGAFLPAELCLLHYTTNETLASMFATASLCVALRVLQVPRPGWGWHGLLGLVMGLAMLSKASTLPIVAVIAGLLAKKLLLRQERKMSGWMIEFVAPLAICLLVAGWHYAKLWRDFGNPLAGNWDAKVAQPWWQAKGFHTAGYFLGFGQVLTRPFFSGLHSFWDGIYCTLWGDGMMGGVTDIWARPPWNYNFMAAGYLLALVPAIFVLTGLVRAVVRCLRAPGLPWLLMIGVAWIFAFAIVWMSLKIPCYAQVKAFYALPIALPLCAFGAVGFEFWSGRGAAMRYAAAVLLGLWLLNVGASFWIRPGTLQSEVSVAISSLFIDEDHAKPFLKVFHDYPDDHHAAVWQAVLAAKKSPQDAVEQLRSAMSTNPPDTRLEYSLANDLGELGQLDEAVTHVQRAIELAPDNISAHQTLVQLELRRKHYTESLAAARRALALNPTDTMTRFNLGVDLMNLRQIPEATSQFEGLVDFNPEWAEAQYCLGRCLLGQPETRDAAIHHLQEAVNLAPSNPAMQAALKNALQGR